MQSWALGSTEVTTSPSGWRVLCSVLLDISKVLQTEAISPYWKGSKVIQCSLGYSLQPVGIFLIKVQSTQREQREGEVSVWEAVDRKNTQATAAAPPRLSETLQDKCNSKD